MFIPSVVDRKPSRSYGMRLHIHSTSWSAIEVAYQMLRGQHCLGPPIKAVGIPYTWRIGVLEGSECTFPAKKSISSLSDILIKHLKIGHL